LKQSREKKPQGKEAIELITSGIGSVLYATTFIPGLSDSDERPEPIGNLTSEQAELIAKLPSSEIEIIDKLLLSEADVQWRKVARIVGAAMMANIDRQNGIPDVFYAQRIRRLVKDGLLESQGNLDFMRFSEVRLTAQHGSK
jgi:hypothetical protein